MRARKSNPTASREKPRQSAFTKEGTKARGNAGTKPAELRSIGLALNAIASEIQRAAEKIYSANVLCVLCVFAVLICGCGVPAVAVMAQAQSMHRATAEYRNAAAEWSADVEQGDSTREAAIIAAFAQRLRAKGATDSQVAEAIAQFTAALGKIRADRYAADERLRVVLDNCDALDESADALHQLALDSQSLDDEWRRYVTNNFAAWKTSQAEAAQARAAARTARQQRRADIVGQILKTLPIPTSQPSR